MTDLFKKLNTLISASINDVLEEAQKGVSEPLKHIPRHRLGKNIGSEVDKLREQVNKALAYEDELVARVQSIESEIAQLDQQADAAVAAGQEEQARYLIERLNRAQQRLRMTQSDLTEHRIVTQDLIMRVNQLDATISEAMHAEANQPVSATPEQTSPAQPTVTSTPTTGEAALEQARVLSERANKVLADVLREAREKVTEMGVLVEQAQAGAAVEIKPTVTEQVETEISKSAVEDDLAARLARLSKPAHPTGNTAQSKPKQE